MAKGPAKNLTIREYFPVRIDRVQEHDYSILQKAKASGNWDGVYDVVFAGPTLRESSMGVNDPQANIGILIYTLAAAAIGRPSQSHVLLYDSTAYYMCTHSDIYEFSSSAPPKAVRDNKLIKFAYRERDQYYFNLLCKAINL